MTTTEAVAATTSPPHSSGKERDAETGLDYFGARYLSSAQGRWMSPDWSEKPEPVPYADLKDPQSLNLYGYVRNNPLKNTDPNGHWCLFGKIGTTCGGDVPAPPPPAPPPPPPMTGINPVSGTPFFSAEPRGEEGHERPGVGGRGYFGASRANGARPHLGEDVSGEVGSSVYAATGGTVVFSGVMQGYGNTIIIDNGQGVQTVYSHNSENGVRVGDHVNRGDVVADVGQTGNAQGQPASESHVHFEVRINGKKVDPAVWLNSAVSPR